jgi:hypothetical protein
MLATNSRRADYVTSSRASPPKESSQALAGLSMLFLHADHALTPELNIQYIRDSLVKKQIAEGTPSSADVRLQ